ncbi:MAG: hypothetical protein ACREP9_17535 [Candidatus Dormibacteraceae bacterium]
MTKPRKHLYALLAAATVAIAPAGCVSTETTSEAVPHNLTVIDAVTKLPVAGAVLKLSAPGMTMANRTDERGMIDFGALAFRSRPKPEGIEITMQGYGRVSFLLTNGLPRIVEMTRVQSPK